VSDTKSMRGKPHTHGTEKQTAREREKVTIHTNGAEDNVYGNESRVIVPYSVSCAKDQQHQIVNKADKPAKHRTL